uniref:Uncharacterized protein n=1 Tax=Tetranychus urticae TaxID=32264 RepID=T1K8D3_TETUR
METFNNWWDVEQFTVCLMVKDRIKNRFGEISIDADFQDFVPGFVLHEKPKMQERFLQYLGCGFCHHIPWYPRTKDILKCDDCPTVYCWLCARLLATMYQKRNGNPAPNLDEFEKSYIDCATCLKRTKIHPINSDERETYHNILVKCKTSKCDYIGNLINVQRHMEGCKSKTYKISSVLNYLHESQRRRRNEPREDEDEEPQEFLNSEDFVKAFDQRLMIQYPGTYEEIAKRKWEEASKIAGVPDIGKELAKKNTERADLSQPSTSTGITHANFWDKSSQDELIWSDDERQTEKEIRGEKAIAAKVSTAEDKELLPEKDYPELWEEARASGQAKASNQPQVRDYGIESEEDEEWEGAAPALPNQPKTVNRDLPASINEFTDANMI